MIVGVEHGAVGQLIDGLPPEVPTTQLNSSWQKKVFIAPDRSRLVGDLSLELGLVLRRRVGNRQLDEGRLERFLKLHRGGAPIVPTTRAASGEECGDAVVALLHVTHVQLLNAAAVECVDLLVRVEVVGHFATVEFRLTASS